MGVREDMLEELRSIRARIDQIAAALVGEQTREELMPVWDCGHRHRSRREAVECKKGQQFVKSGKSLLEGRESDNLRVPGER